MRRRNALIPFIAACLTACQARTPAPPSAEAKPQPAADQPIAVEGLHNVWRVTDGLYSGSSPDGEAGFASLKRLGVRTVISVDGARPDVDTARKYGLRYVHLPIGYDGVPRGQALRIAKAVRDLPGPVYVHCHHGQHRGPAAAAVARFCTDPSCSVEDALALLHRAGTDPHYAGLYASVREARRPTAAELDAVPGDFREAEAVPALAEAMVGIDERWSRLKAVQAAGWRVPPGHADLDPPHEALQLREQFREAGRLPDAKQRGDELTRRLTEAEALAAELETTLRRPDGDTAAAEVLISRLSQSCKQCHEHYRDVAGRRP